MYLLDARAALHALVSLMILPAAILVAIGIATWYKGNKLQTESKERVGKMTTMFGAILLTILLICLWFLSSLLGLEK